MKHTPGPWTIEGDTIRNTNQEIICLAGGRYGYRRDKSGREEIQANAHLIASAPEMLKALKELHRILYEDEGYALYNPKMKQAEKLINKIEGGLT